ncbi:MAG TPA: glycosyltransferase [Dehalococcoidia bacterium]
MNILHVVPSLSMRTGGPALAVAESARALARAGTRTTIFATDMAYPAGTGDQRAVTQAELPRAVADLDVRLFPARRPYRLAFSPAMLQALRRETGRYDVVHVHSLFLFPQFAAFQQARRAGVPYVVSPRGALDPHLRARSRGIKTIAHVTWQRSMLDHAAALHLTSRAEAELVRDIAPHVPRHVVPNGIDMQRFDGPGDAANFRARYMPDRTGPAVLYHGRISHKKGLDVLMRAFASVAPRVPGATLVIAGPDDERLMPALASLAMALGIRERVVFTGMLAADDVRDALAAAHVWALASRSENFANAFVEAMAAGLPCVVTPHVNIASDAVAAGAAIVAPVEPVAFAREIEQLLGDPDRRASLGERARQFSQRFDWDAVTPQLVAMYESVRALVGVAA